MTLPDSTLTHRYAGRPSFARDLVNPALDRRYKHRACRVLIRGRGPGPHNRLIEFEDGHRMVVIRRSLRRRYYAEIHQMEMF